MEHIAPLLQTVLWVGLIAAIVIRFNKPIHSLLTALHRRIDAGSAIKAGPFELSELKPQDPTRQKQKAELEIRELLQVENSTPETQTPALAAAAETEYFQAEDLALRAVQVEFGIPISRQVTAGSEVGYDGAFVLRGRLHIVEVKYYRGWVQAAKLRVSLENLAKSVERFGWHNVQVVLVVVFERPADIEPNLKRIEEATVFSAAPVTIRCYAMPELRAKFGATSN